MRSIADVVSSQTISSHDYVYDSAHRRTQATLEDGSIWKYDYNDRNEVISGKRFWNDWTPVAGQQFEYTFDNIGNRTATKAGGDSAGAGLRSASYSANSLNQVTRRSVPSAVDVLGVAKATASVTVNSGAAYEKGEYFHKELSVSNGSGPAYRSRSQPPKAAAATRRATFLCRPQPSPSPTTPTAIWPTTQSGSTPGTARNGWSR